MKEKKSKIILWIVIGVIIIAICIGIQVFLNKDTEKLKEESKKLETLVVQTKSGQSIETEYTHVDENKFYVKVPTNFEQLDYETIIQKYSGDVPKVVFSNPETTINIAISITENDMKNNQIKAYIKYMEGILKQNSEILTSDYYEVDKHNIGKIELISKGVDTDIYNNMICFSYQDKLVIITFNCTKELQEEWQPVGKFIIDSLFFTEE